MFQTPPNASAKCIDNDFGYDAVSPMSILFEKPDPTDINIEEELNAFQFKYVPKEEFARIIKQVRRNKKKEQEEREWMKFLASQQKKSLCESCPEGLRQQTNASVLHLNQAQSLEHMEDLKMEQQYFTKQKSNNGQQLVDMQKEQVQEKQKKLIIYPQQQYYFNKEQENFGQQSICVQDQLPETEKHRKRVIFPQEKHRPSVIQEQGNFRQQMVDIEENQILEFENVNREMLHSQQGCLPKGQDSSQQQFEGIQEDQISDSERQRRQIIFQKISKTLKRDLQKSSQTWISENEATYKNENSTIDRKSFPNQKCQNEVAHCACINGQSGPNRKSQSQIHEDATIQVASISQQSTSRKVSSNEMCQNETVEYACANLQSCRKISPNHISQCITAPLDCIDHRSATDRSIRPNYPSHHSIVQDAESVHSKNDTCLVPKLNLCGSHREGVHSRRIRSIRQKIDSVCDDILLQVEHIPAPDGSQDLMRRRKRASEFSARFARNYIYHLRHQVCELHKQIKQSVSTQRGRHTLHQSMCQKLVSGHQMALQGLQAYLKHMHSSLKGAASEKLKELFENLTELSTLSSQLGVESALDINSIERKSRAVLEQISGLVQHRVAHDLNSMDSQEETVNVMTTTGQRDWENSLREPSKVLLTSQPSSVDNKNSRWQDMATKLARAAYGSPCKKKHLGPCKNRKRIPGSKIMKKVTEKINQKQKPPEPALLEVLPLPAANPPYPPPHPTGPKSLSKLQLIEERKSGDNIKTAIESVPCERKLQDEQCSPKKSGSALKMPSESEMESPYFSDRLLQICEKMMQELVNSIKKQDSDLVCKTSQEDMQAAIQQIQDITSRTLEKVASENSVGTKQKAPVLASRKNVQLICLKASDEEKAENEEIYTKDEQNTGVPPEVAQAGQKPEPNPYMEAPSVDMHSKRILPTGLSVSKKTIRSAMDCRQRFQYHTERNPMYRGTVHPWDMVGRLADRLMIQLLKEMTEEARLDTLIKDIYSLEFQGK